MTQLMAIYKKTDPSHLAKIAISLVYAVGIIGLYWEESRKLFQQLTPFHLLFNAILLVYFHKERNRSFLLFAIFAFVMGMVSEIIGVKTGLIFGDYSYGTVLGFKVLEVPLIIGVNWFLLAYMWGKLAHELKINFWFRTFFAALGMVVMDFIIEPVAVALDFWSWAGAEIPISNYIGWLVIAFLIQICFQILTFQKKNPISNFLLLIMCLFFAILNFLF